MGLDFLLIDDKSTMMQGSINVVHLPKFENSLRDGAIYSISSFEVTRSNTRFKLTDFHLSIRFTPNTLFDELEESFCVIPKEHFRFLTHEQLLSLGNTNTELPDVMGQVCSTKAYHNGVTQNLERMSVHLRLESGEKVQVSAFDHHATSLEKIFGNKDDGTYIMLATSINPKIIGGALYLNATSGTKFYFDEDFATTREFVKRLKGKEKESTNPIQQYHGVQKIEHAAIDELNQFVATGNEQDAGAEFLCTATVTDIQSERGWSFISCASCGNKMVKKHSSLACQKFNCGSSTIGDVKYRVELVVHDGLTSGVFVAFDKDMFSLINIEATKLASQMADANQNSDSEALPNIITDIVGKKFTFQIKLTPFNFTPYHQSFTICRIFETTEAAPKPTFCEEVQAKDVVEAEVQSSATTLTALNLANKSSSSSSSEKASHDLSIVAEEEAAVNKKQKKQKCN